MRSAAAVAKKSSYREDHEPVYSKGLDLKTWLPGALQWYRKNTTPKQQKAWLVEWVEKWNQDNRLPFSDAVPFTQAETARVRHADLDACVGIGSLAKLLLENVPFDKATVNKLVAQVKAIPAPKIKKAPKKPDSESTIDKELCDIIFKIEVNIDSLAKKPNKVGTESWRAKINRHQHEAIVSRFQPLYDELVLVAEEADDELLEAYGNIRPVCIDALLHYLESVFEIEAK